MYVARRMKFGIDGEEWRRMGIYTAFGSGWEN